MITENMNPEVSYSDKRSTTPRKSEHFWEAQSTRNPPDQMADIRMLLQNMMVDKQKHKEQQKLTSKN